MTEDGRQKTEDSRQ